MTIDVRACSLPVSRPKTCGNATSLVQRVRSVVHARWLVQTHVCARDMPRPCTRRGRAGTARVLHLSWCGSIDVVVQAGVQPGQTLSLLQCRRRRICRACQAREWRSWRTHGLPLWTVDAGRPVNTLLRPATGRQRSSTCTQLRISPCPRVGCHCLCKTHSSTSSTCTCSGEWWPVKGGPSLYASATLSSRIYSVGRYELAWHRASS